MTREMALEFLASLSQSDIERLRMLIRQGQPSGAERHPVLRDLAQLSNNLGDQRAGRFLALVTGQEPTDADASGSFVSAQGEQFGDWLIKVGEVLNGQLQAGFGNGRLVWAGGAGVGDSEGLNLTGIRYALRHYATDEAGNNPRYGRMEMFYPLNKTIPSLRIAFEDGTDNSELVANHDFATDDFTNWTNSLTGDGAWSVPAGSGLARYYNAAGGVGGTGLLYSDRCTVTAGSKYSVSIGRVTSFAYFIAYVDWYDHASAGNLILATTIINTGSASGFGTITKTITAPVGALSCSIRFAITNAGGCLVTISPISMKFISDSRSIFFDPDLTYNNGLTDVKIVAGIKELYVPLAPVIAQDVTASGNCTNGSHSVKIAFADADGETTPSPASNSVTVDAAHTQIVVPLAIGPAGTTKRLIYMTEAGGSVYKLAETISDNTTTVTYLSIADAGLGVTPSVTNTTGGRPLYPRSATAVAPEMRIYNASWVNQAPVITHTVNQDYACYTGLAAADANDGDRLVCNMFLEAGTYDFTILGVSSATSGKTDFYIDGVLITSGIDWYSASTTYNVASLQAGKSVVGNGYHRIELVVNGKNGSSGDYRILMTYISADQEKY